MNGVSQDAFTYMLWIVVIVGSIAAIITFATTGESLKQIGRGGLFDENDLLKPAPSPASAAVRDDEIRQMLEAKNLRRARRGEPPLDIEAELQALVRPAVDRQLVLEIRELVEARNYRRIRQGREPLDVEAEVERRLRDLP